MSIYKKIAFLFPGQGSQYAGMGLDFYDKFPVVKETFEEADDVLGRNLSKIILNGPEIELTETKNSQTGIFVTSIGILRAVQKEFPHLIPSVTAGLSLGEYTALTASKRVTFSGCLPLVQYRGQYMNDACEKHPGTMAVVLGLSAEIVEKIIKDLKMPHVIFVANLNCPGQVVISGTQNGIDAATVAAKDAGAKRVLPLNVHGAFHSGLMADAETRLSPHIKEAPLTDSSIEFVMNVPGNFVKDLSDIRKFLTLQVTHPVKWEDSVKHMAAAGVDLFLEIGPGKTLGALIKRIGVDVPVISIEKIADLENI
jgi:[acyl-carrier-protein] S-malonyltransferase